LRAEVEYFSAFCVRLTADFIGYMPNRLRYIFKNCGEGTQKTEFLYVTNNVVVSIEKSELLVSRVFSLFEHEKITKLIKIDNIKFLMFKP
jgi:hypothetical protein